MTIRAIPRALLTFSLFAFANGSPAADTTAIETADIIALTRYGRGAEMHPARTTSIALAATEEGRRALTGAFSRATIAGRVYIVLALQTASPEEARRLNAHLIPTDTVTTIDGCCVEVRQVEAVLADAAILDR